MLSWADLSAVFGDDEVCWDLTAEIAGWESAVMSSPTDTDRDNFIRALAKQAYRHDVLIKALRAHGYLGARELESLENAEEFDGFLKVFSLYFKRKPRPRESGES